MGLAFSHIIMTLKQYRTDHLAWAMQDAADKLGISRQLLNRWENGNATPSGTTLMQISSVYNCVISFVPETDGATLIKCMSQEDYAKIQPQTQEEANDELGY